MNFTFKEVVELWYTTKERMVKQSTMFAYRLILKTHLLPYFGDAILITEDDVRNFIITKIDNGLSSKTIRDIVAVLKSIAKYGQKIGLYQYNEWNVYIPTDTNHTIIQVLHISYQRKLTKYLIQNVSSQNIGILIALCTGMRIGEICGLRWSDIDFTKRTITVKRTISRIYDCNKKTTIKIQTSPKTKTSYREIPISSILFPALNSLKDKKSTYIVGDSDNPKDPRTYRDFFTRLLKKLSIPKIVFHGLRHTFATRCIESQCDYKTVSVILGHSNISTTLNLYVHPNLNQKKRCIERMNKILGI